MLSTELSIEMAMTYKKREQGKSGMRSWVAVTIGGALLGAVVIGNWLDSRRAVPSRWLSMVTTKGQAFPIPVEWIATEEGKVAHDLVLPDAVPKPVPFDFEKEDGPWFWKKSTRELGLAYFRHLCRTEAGEWIFEKPENVEGLYFARPEGEITEAYLSDLYGPEAPWVEREFLLIDDSIDGRGGQFVRPPFRNYLFVEEPRRDVAWQRDFMTPYVKIYGYTSKHTTGKGGVFRRVEELSPMRVEGENRRSSGFGYTWRGIHRPRDRELNIAGGELIIYEIETKRVIAISRTFQFSDSTNLSIGGAKWQRSPGCGKAIEVNEPLMISQFSKRVLKEPQY